MRGVQRHGGAVCWGRHRLLDDEQPLLAGSRRPRASQAGDQERRPHGIRLHRFRERRRADSAVRRRTTAALAAAFLRAALFPHSRCRRPRHWSRRRPGRPRLRAAPDRDFDGGRPPVDLGENVAGDAIEVTLLRIRLGNTQNAASAEAFAVTYDPSPPAIRIDVRPDLAPAAGTAFRFGSCMPTTSND